MHRAINIKHRIVRRVDIGKAPLATFDTVDLGDEDVTSYDNQQKSPKTTVSIVANENHPSRLALVVKPRAFVGDGNLKTETIGGNTSKKSLSQAGGEEKECKDVDHAKDKQTCSGEVANLGDTNQSRDAALTEPHSSETRKLEPKLSEPPATVKTDTAASCDREGEVDRAAPKQPTVSNLTRQGTIGRVSIPIKKQDSDSSSSSSGSCKDTSFTFHSTRPSVGHLDGTDADACAQEYGADRDGPDSLFPDAFDPSLILSPSKRKAYERRIERLKVTTSPIARPRSTTPISVVTLDEYAAISSPEPSPASLCITQDKLRITLPSDEFTAKPKTPKLHSAKKHDSDDTCFEFTEEILFCRTKSALVVDEDGHLPLSPRRVLIPPTLTPTTSPKLSGAPRLSAGVPHEETSAGIPKLIYIQHNETAQKLFGDTIDETSDKENWAHFPDTSETDGQHSLETVATTNASLACDTTALSQQFTSWPGDEFSSSAFGATKTLPGRTVEYQNEIVTKYEINPVYDPTVGQTISSSFDQSEVRTALDISKELNFSSTEQRELPGLALQLEFGSEEEILTVEISEGAPGCEKHIEIEIKSSGSSGSISPAGSEPPQRLDQLGQDHTSFIPKVHSDSFLFSHFGAENESLPVPQSGVIIKSQSDNSSLFLLENQQLQTADTHTVQDLSITDQTLQGAFLLSDTQVSENQADFVVPQSGAAFIPESYFNSHRPPKIPPRPGQTQLQFNSGFQLQQQQQQASTNPFISSFQPVDSDPFDLGLHRASSTNPFLSDSSSVTRDLIDLSASFEHHST